MSEFDLKYCYFKLENNWPMKNKPKIDAIDLILYEEIEFEEEHNGDGDKMKNSITLYYYKHLKLVYKHEREDDARSYVTWCQYHFNKRFKAQYQIDDYFGRYRSYKV